MSAWPLPGPNGPPLLYGAYFFFFFSTDDDWTDHRPCLINGQSRTTDCWAARHHEQLDTHNKVDVGASDSISSFFSPLPKSDRMREERWAPTRVLRRVHTPTLHSLARCPSSALSPTHSSFSQCANSRPIKKDLFSSFIGVGLSSISPYVFGVFIFFTRSVWINDITGKLNT
jgi:hypothetical protein